MHPWQRCGYALKNRLCLQGRNLLYVGGHDMSLYEILSLLISTILLIIELLKLLRKKSDTE